MGVGVGNNSPDSDLLMLRNTYKDFCDFDKT